MPLINFKDQFANKILNGSKKQTIRLMRKVPIKAGDKLHLFTGLRTKNTKKLRIVTCKEASELLMNLKTPALAEYFLNGNKISLAEMEKIANADGFVSFEQFRQFFLNTHKNPYFKGQLIKW